MSRPGSPVPSGERWDRHADRYDAATAWVERRLLAAGRRWAVPRATGRTLEVGVGTGANLPHYGADVLLTAVDPSARMLDQTRAKLPARTLGTHPPARPAGVELVRAEAEDLPFADGGFDSVVATYVLCCVGDLDRSLAEMARVLRPGGRLLLSDHVVSTSWPLRMGQRLLEAVTVPAQEEHFTRRPLPLLAAHGLAVEESRRAGAGVFEWVQAVRTPPADRA